MRRMKSVKIGDFGVLARVAPNLQCSYINSFQSLII